MYWDRIKCSIHPQFQLSPRKEAAHASYFDAELPLFELLFQRSHMAVNTNRSLGEFLDNLC